MRVDSGGGTLARDVDELADDVSSDSSELRTPAAWTPSFWSNRAPRSGGRQTEYTAPDRVSAWAVPVSVVERGYDDVYQYANDLYYRNRLHEARLLLEVHLVQF
ncbi:hypothetical protein ACFU9B_43190 [Streptomyces sp. NPDC057592]|uniref:hypothetical protein n=1 Tax=unclassified Streptomyces TaxID=2593676 RepID=UPI0036B370C9